MSTKFYFLSFTPWVGVAGWLVLGQPLPGQSVLDPPCVSFHPLYPYISKSGLP